MSGQILDTEKYKYKRIRVRDKNTGKVRYSANNGDAVARAMFGMDKGQMVRVMNENGLTGRLGHHSAKNAGHFRMVLGQALRSIIARGEQIHIAGRRIAALSQQVPLPQGFQEEQITPRTKNTK